MGIVSNAMLILSGVYLSLGLMYLRFWRAERSRREFTALAFSSRSLFVSLLLAVVVPAFCQAAVANDSEKRVLILAGDSNDFPAVAKMDEGFRRTLTASSPFRLSYYRETLDVSRIRISDFESGLVEYLQQKYQFQQPDLIVMIGAATIRFMAKHEQALFAGVPKVLIYYDRSQLAQHESDLPRSVSIVSKIEIGPTLDIILTQNPGTKRVVVVTGDPSGDRRWLDLAEKDLAPYADRIEFEQTGGLTMDDLRSKLAELPPNTPILFISSPPDSSGNLMNVAEGATMIAPSANAPVYSILDTSMGNGVLGGQVLSFESMGIRAAEVGQRILAGEEPKNIPQQDVPTVPMFDWRQLKRWGISEASLPQGSIVQFRQPTVWEEYKWYAIGLIAAVIVETLLIAWLLYLRLRRRQAETEAARLSGRLAEIVANVPGIVWESRTDPDENVRKTTFISDYVEQMLGYSSREWLAGQPGFGFRIVPQDDRERVKRELEEVAEGGKGTVMEYPWRAKDGRIRWVQNHVTPLRDEENGIIGLRGVALDITERNAAQQAVREREMRLAETLDQLQLSAAAANVGFWTRRIGEEKIWFSEKAADVLGFPSGTQVKREDIFQRIHPADREPYITNFNEVEEWKNEYQIEYRVLSDDGNVRWIHSRGKVETANGSRVIRGAIVDITKLKMAEEAIHELSGKLMNAQEKERARLARELHDDLSQRIALHAIQLTMLRNEPRDLEYVKVQLDQFVSDVEHLSRDVHRISHELHPAKLTQLGLEAALRSFCTELTEAHLFEIDFEAKNLPRDLPQDISLCFYRVAQESLHNVIKHSGATSVDVSIRFDNGEVHLSISDNGNGFDPTASKVKESLGLISIEERVRAVKGEAKVISAIGAGTTIEVHAPVRAL